MSQSPLDSRNPTGLESYRQGWKALNRLLHENKSFSGRETNNAFLNCGDGGPFADVSTAIGWDFADDARAIGLIDYDQDGDLDLFVTNRTAPRVRLLQNNLKSDASFLALHLTGNGKTTPRDAIGARVAVHLKDQAIPSLRTLHAGQSFLSQSSRWLHFGLGKDATIEKIIVHWPGAKPQTFTNIQPNQFLHLTQGSNTATTRSKPAPNILKASPQTLPPVTSLARIIPPAGNAVPDLPTADGKTLAFKTTTLISLWSRTCPHCRQELTTRAKEFQKLQTSGINLILFATDQEPRAQCDAYLKSIGSTFPAEMASPQAVEMLDALQASIVDLWIPIPVPSSFLVSAEDELLAIYRGPVTTNQVITDARLATATPLQRRNAGTPFTGRWVGAPDPATPQRTTTQLLQRARPDLAITYLKSALAKPFVKGTKINRADNLLLLGQLLGQQARPSEAISPLKEARKLLPEDIRTLRLLATAFFETGDPAKAFKTLDEAIILHPQNADLHLDGRLLATKSQDHPRALYHLEKAADLTPGNPSLRLSLAQYQVGNGQAQKAIENCKTILRTSPRFLDAAAFLSRILSTHPNEKIRSPKEALALSTRLCQITKNGNNGYLFSLALAKANLEQFDEAEKIILQFHDPAGPLRGNFTKQVHQALTAIRQNKPYRTEGWQ